MRGQNHYHIASQQLEYLRRHKTARALWIVGDAVFRTPNTDRDVAQMLDKGAVLVGVFDGDMPGADLAEAIIAADADRAQSG